MDKAPGHILLADWIDASRATDTPFVVGISGAPGSGKTTLCAQVEATLAAVGVRCVTLSLDDLYLTRAQREARARAVHPLCAVRGPPGTHDTALGVRILDTLATARPGQVTHLPRFDKATDDRREERRLVRGRPDVILFEGWCVLATPGPPWREAANAREARDDPDGEWVRWTEATLATEYPPLWQRVQGSVYLASSFESAVEGRWRQEQALRTAQPEGAATMTHPEVEAFMALFERKVREMATVMPEVADWTLSLIHI